MGRNEKVEAKIEEKLLAALDKDMTSEEARSLETQVRTIRQLAED